EPAPADLAVRPDWPHAVARDLAAAAAWLLGGTADVSGASPSGTSSTDISRSEPS
ncbi:HAD family hydrolase, partial [Desulfovibrio sp. XJ01]|nr:HAD family hydrolase [Nitratidesulfovibrio liaohensis]